MKHKIWAWQKSFTSKIRGRKRNEKKTKVDQENEEIRGDKGWKTKSFKFSILFLEFILQIT